VTSVRSGVALSRLSRSPLHPRLSFVHSLPLPDSVLGRGRGRRGRAVLQPGSPLSNSPGRNLAVADMKTKSADAGGSNHGSDGGSAAAAGNKRHKGTDDQARMEEVNIIPNDLLPEYPAIACRGCSFFLLLSVSLSSLSLSSPPCLSAVPSLLLSAVCRCM
jgi:hypothetical protein